MPERVIPKHVFHYVDRRTLWSSARKPFWPASHGGQRIHVESFQPILRQQKNKIGVAVRLIKDPANGLDQITYLGKDLLADVNVNYDLANYLFITGIIHPRFFAEAIHVIASNGKALAPVLTTVRLKKLGRENIKKALDSGAIQTLEIGKNFDRFSQRPPQQRLEILVQLGALELKPGANLPDLKPARPIAPPAARPPVQRSQLDFLSKLDPEKK
jgi:hypothetical protein